MDFNTFSHNWQMPSPAELANRAKTSTVLVSLRIKQETKSFFEAQAAELSKTEEGDASDKKGKVTSSTLMNGLLDAYADAYTRMAEKHPIATYMIEDARKLATKSDEELLYRLYIRYKGDEDHDDIATFNGAGGLYYAFQEKYYEDIFLYAWPAGGMFITATGNKKAEYGADEEFDAIDMLVPAAKFPLVANLILDFRLKLDKMKLYLEPNSALMDRLIKAINGNQNKARMAEEIARILVEYEEDFND